MLLSIVIPTKDRYYSLCKTVYALSTLELPETEIIVQDNTEDNREVVGKFDCYKQVKYFHDSSAMSVSENSDIAIKHSCGKYVIFLGDDDAITPEIIKVVEFMNKHRIDACCVPYAKYNWPELMEEASLNNSVELLDKRDGKIEIVDCQKELISMMRETTFSLRIPKVYQGIVSREILELIWSKTGTYFPGPSPDMANGVAVSLLSNKVIQINSPIIIAGFSKKSAAGLGTMKKHVATIENVPWLKKSVLENWDARIPRIWTGQTIWAESLIKALESMGNSGLIRCYNFKRLYSSFLVSHPDLIKYVLEVKCISKYLVIFDLPIYIIIKLKNKVISALYSKKQFTSFCDRKIEIEEAIALLQQYIDNNPISYL